MSGHPQSHDEQSLMDLIRDLEERGITNRRAQAEALGMHYRTYLRRRKALGIPAERAPLDWIPWTVREEHHSDPLLRRLRYLAAAAERRPTQHEMKRAQAIRWARGLVDDGMDISYDRSGGFRVVQANPADWYLRRLLDAAMSYLTGHPDVS